MYIGQLVGQQAAFIICLTLYKRNICKYLSGVCLLLRDWVAWIPFSRYMDFDGDVATNAGVVRQYIDFTLFDTWVTAQLLEFPQFSTCFENIGNLDNYLPPLSDVQLVCVFELQSKGTLQLLSISFYNILLQSRGQGMYLLQRKLFKYGWQLSVHLYEWM